MKEGFPGDIHIQWRKTFLAEMQHRGWRKRPLGAPVEAGGERDFLAGRGKYSQMLQIRESVNEIGIRQRLRVRK